MIRIGIVGLTGILLALFLKETKPVYAAFLSLAVCMIIFFYALEKLSGVLRNLGEIREDIQLKSAYFEILLKIVGITYIADFSAGLCKDAGFGAIAGQIEFFGKLSILALCMPIVTALFETVYHLLG